MIDDDRQERWQCQFCEYWQDKREYHWEDTIPGECHLLPPTVVCDTSDIGNALATATVTAPEMPPGIREMMIGRELVSVSKWPETMPWDWCGQWKRHYRLENQMLTGPLTDLSDI